MSKDTIKQAAKSWIYAAPSFVVDFLLFWILNSFVLIHLKTKPFIFGPFNYGIGDGGLCTFISTAISYFVSMIVNYIVQRKYVFKSNVDFFKGLVIYMLTTMISYVIVLYIPGIIGNYINSIFGHHVGSLITKAIAEAIGFFIQFPINKYIIMK